MGNDIHTSIFSVYFVLDKKRSEGYEDSMNYNHITVAGSGVLGSQIIFQTAYKGFTVSASD